MKDLNAQYAEDLGIRARTVRAAGGAEKLKSLTPEARELLLRPYKLRQATPQPQVRPPMSQKALGMTPGVPGLKRVGER